MLQTKGPWCKVEVSGQINGRGWVYARYLKRINPEAMKSEPSTPPVRSGSGPGDDKQEVLPVVQVPGIRIEEKELEPPDMLLPAATRTSRSREQAAARQAPPATKYESTARSSIAALMNAWPNGIPPEGKASERSQEKVPEITGKILTEPVEGRAAVSVQKTIPEEKKIRSEAARKTVPAVSQPPRPDAPVLVPPVMKSSVYPETKGSPLKQQSMGAFSLALKLISILLYGLIVLLLYKRSRE
jgi:hypothetical protein